METKKKIIPVPLPETSIDDAVQELLVAAGSLKTSELFFEMSKNLICVIGKDGFFKKVSRSFVQASGYSSEELLSYPYVDFVIKQEKMKNNVSSSYYFNAHFCCRSNRIMKLRWRVIPDLCGEHTVLLGWEIE